jgi:hypothetical protein
MKGAARMSAGRGGVSDVVRAEGVKHNAAADHLRGVHAVLGKDEKALTADRATDAGGESRLLTYVHGGPAFVLFVKKIVCGEELSIKMTPR